MPLAFAAKEVRVRNERPWVKLSDFKLNYIQLIDYVMKETSAEIIILDNFFFNKI